jgi:CxxC-x17-CxxC domain-containing protein
VTLLNREDGTKWRQLERGLGRKIPRLRWQGVTFASVEATAPPRELPEQVDAEQRSRRRRKPKAAAEVAAQPAPQPARVQPEGQSDRQRRKSKSVEDFLSRPASQQTNSQAPAQPKRERPEDPLGNFLKKLSVSGTAMEPAPPSRPAKSEAGRSRSRGAREDQGKSERFRVECAACGTATTVPFEPTNGRPVYCRACYAAMKGASTPSSRPDRHDVRSSGAETTYAE